MRKHFSFTDGSSFRGEESRELAALLLRSSSGINKRLKDDLGISIEYSDASSRISHDGRKVGICTCKDEHTEFTVTIAPKIETLRIRAIVESFGAAARDLPALRIDDVASLSGVTESNDDFSVTFLLSLLRDIIDSAPFVNELSHARHRRYIHAGIKGRPLLEKSLTDVLLGRAIGFTCETLSDIHLQDYKRVILATGLEIADALGIWSGVLSASLASVDTNKSRLRHAFPGTTATGVNLSTVLRVCRPPFPFGIKDLLYRCLRFWKWHSHYRTADKGGAHESFYSLSISLDKFFEHYVRLVAKQASQGILEFLIDRHFVYKTNYGTTATPGAIDLDCLLHAPHTALLLIVEAKYSVNTVAQDHLFQVVTYCNYGYPQLKPTNKVAILIYPGDEFSIGKIEGFDVPILVVAMPVPASSAVPPLRALFQRLMANALAV